ncbi:hypothetical protein BDQ12DRAFT_736063 [Crucibulum laeve]|uniref:NAD(P)-binding protein n=1 Tax=Crucibulum laeve TaxID=68775 RepID=A0A5C3LZJ5_9AGAR|nr:hypothetical protein BDQ12DRAFT_736063 [Crucibulum laeve]
MDLGLTGVHVLVTGASGGIGLESVRVFLDQGAKVTAHYNTNSSSLTPLIEKYGSNRIQSIQANIGEEASVLDMFSSASKTFKAVQVLVVNHGIFPPPAPLWEISLERWQNTLNINLTGSFLVTREYLRQLKSESDSVKEKASIVFIGSTAGKIGCASYADYAASKSAMMYGLPLSLKNEIVKIAPRGRVNAIGPGFVKTEMIAEALKDPKVLYMDMATTPLRKVATPFDVATQIVLLSSQKVSGHVNGQVVMVDGGLEGRLQNQPEDIFEV